MSSLLLGWILAISNPLTPLEHALRHVLDWLHGTVGLPWAWSIVVLTVIIRILIVPLAVKQIRSMQNLQRYAPQLKELQKKYAHDKAKQREELMKFYSEHKINPAASCLPMLPQLPIFFSLYYVLRHFANDAKIPEKAATLGDLHWLGIFKITEKASHGWGPVLLVLYATSQVASVWLMSATADKTQRYIMTFLPVVFIAVIVNFPQGLVIYWVTTNLWTTGQGLITRRLIPKTAAPLKKTSRSPGRAQPAPAIASGKPKSTGTKPRKVKRKKQNPPKK
jgi:YidC/Oxa1 family membrane protein insertase